MEQKIDKILEDMTMVKVALATNTVTLAANTQSLQEHMRRTEQLEERVEPLEKTAAMWAGVNKFLVIAGLVIGLVVTVVKFIHP